MLKKLNKNLSIEQKYTRLKKIYVIQFVIFTSFIIIMSIFIYYNYNYIAFKHLISQNYIDTDTLDKLYETELGIIPNKEYYKYFDNLVISLVTKEIRKTNNDVYTYQYTPEKYKQSKQDDKIEAAESLIQQLTNKTASIKISNFSKYTKKFLFDNISTLSEYENLIIDLRGNLGGDIDALHEMADLFLDTGMIIATDKTRINLFTKTIISKTPPKLNFKDIVILQDSHSASASEGFISALRENLDNVTLIGDTTYGKGIGQITIPLTHGYAVKATILEWYTPKGESIHKIGIPPDIDHDTTSKDILNFAITICEN